MADLRAEFLAIFPELVTEILAPERNSSEVQYLADALDHMERVLNYNTPGGKLNRGLALVASARHLAASKSHTLSDKENRQALVLGWCVELLQAFFLVADDVMDKSITRRGQPCWYKVDGVGLMAVNDSFLINSTIFRLLKLYFGDSPAYVHLLELFIQVSYQTELGQSLDLITAPTDSIDLSKFSTQRYKSIVLYKTAFYSFYLPVAAAMFMLGYSDPGQHEAAKAILLPMGEYFQIQDDYLDCYGDPAVTGKIGTDIQDNKCSWLVVQALDRVTDEQKKLLEENYGRDEEARIAAIRALFDDLKLEQLYREYEDTMYAKLQAMIAEQSALPPVIFGDFLQKLFKRNK
ncbi:farnesyl pyrophosphate synthase-like [Sycon ciliatum]|uniref:farnesyl pyrophosphate synthase-like n=1 Tax=Sycon ciliatum TaxID=27933 RepID=UPI0031F704E3